VVRARSSSSATIARDIADGPRWPLRESLAQRVTDERGLADPESCERAWRATGIGSEADTSVSEARLVSDETTEIQLRLGATSDTLAVDGVVLDEHGHPLANRCLFAWIDENTTASVTSDGVFRKWAGGRARDDRAAARASVGTLRSAAVEGARGSPGIVFRRKTAGEWVDATVRVVDRSTARRSPLSSSVRHPAAVAHIQPVRTFDGRHAALPVAEGLQMVVSAPGFREVHVPITCCGAGGGGWRARDRAGASRCAEAGSIPRG
jgi:hypothetical protein